MALVRKRIEKKPTTGKIVPKKPKPEKLAKAEKATKPKKIEEPTSIAVVERVPMAIATFQQTSPEAPASSLSKSFVSEARKLDERIVKTIDRMSKDFVSLGEAFDEVQRKGYHTALGFRRFEDYLAARQPDQGKTQTLQAMRIVRELISGPNPVATPEEVRGMTRENAEAVARLKKAGVKITPDIIQEARTMTVKDFNAEKVLTQLPDLAQRAAIAQGTHLASAPVILVKRTINLTSPTEAMRVKCFDIVRFLGDKTTTDASFEDEAFATIFGHFIAEYGADYEQAIAAQEAKEAANAQHHSDGMVDVTDSAAAAALADESADEVTNDVANTAEASEDGEKETQTPEAFTHQAHDFGDEDFQGEDENRSDNHEGESSSEESNEEHHGHEG